MVLIDSRPAGEAAKPLPASVARPERSTRMLTPRVPLLFLVADTGGGHRSAARAVSEALEEAYPGRFDPVLCDPLAGPGSSRLLRWVTSLYGPVIRLAPWAWGVAICGRNLRLQRRLAARASRARGRLTVLGFVDNMSDWLRCGQSGRQRFGGGSSRGSR